MDLKCRPYGSDRFEETAARYDGEKLHELPVESTAEVNRLAKSGRWAEVRLVARDGTVLWRWDTERDGARAVRAAGDG